MNIQTFVATFCFLFLWPRFFSVLTSLMTHKYKEVYAAAAEVLGLALAYMDSNLQVRDGQAF